MADAPRTLKLLRPALVCLLVAAGCDALAPAPSPSPSPSPSPVDAPASARPEPPPAKTAAKPPDTRRPVVPGYLAPADGAPPKPAATPAITPEPTGAAPPWRQLLAEADALRSSGVWDDMAKSSAAEKRAFAAIRALPADDPDYVEAQCVLARRGHVGADVEAALLGAIARVRAHPPADNHAYLDRDDLLVTVLGAAILDDGSVQVSPSTNLTSVADCEQADLATLEALLIESYHSYGMFRRAYEGTPPPAVPDAFVAASTHLLDYHAELVRTFGAKHPRPAALVERLYWACHWSHRRKHPKICFKEDDAHKAYEQALAAREKALGEDHPLTRASLLRVAAARLAAGKADEARALLARAMAGELDTRPKATAAALSALLALQAGQVDDALALFARVEAAGDRAYGDDIWSFGQVLQLHSDALRVQRRPVDALRVLRRALALQPKPPPGSPAYSQPGYAELLAAAGESDAAIAEYAIRLAQAVELERTGANAPARQMGRDDRLAVLRARAAVRRAAGDAAGADADLAEVRAIEQGPPVPPDP